MERLLLIRHGETEWNRDGRPQGVSDVPLSATGRRQAAALGQALGAEPLVAVYASDLQRARDTATAIAEKQALPIQTDPRLREMNQGIFEGLPIQQLREQHAEWLRTWQVDPVNVRMPSGETLAEVQIRAVAALAEIQAAHPDGTVAVVAHNFTNLTILCSLLHLDLMHFRHLRVGVASLSRIEFGRWPVLTALNDTRHLRTLD